MFERFTDRARRVVVLAQEEARMLNHNYIGTQAVVNLRRMLTQAGYRAGTADTRASGRPAGRSVRGPRDV